MIQIQIIQLLLVKHNYTVSQKSAACVVHIFAKY